MLLLVLLYLLSGGKFVARERVLRKYGIDEHMRDAGLQASIPHTGKKFFHTTPHTEEGGGKIEIAGGKSFPLPSHVCVQQKIT